MPTIGQQQTHKYCSDAKWVVDSGMASRKFESKWSLVKAFKGSKASSGIEVNLLEDMVLQKN